MAYQALVHGPTGQVIEFKEGGEDVRFEVSPELTWVEGPETIEEGLQPPDFEYDEETEVISRRVFPDPPHDLARRLDYPSVEEQLDLLWHDMDEGRIAGKDTSRWFGALKSVKNAHPSS
jgi:hypothetical protein